jgi:hypothetical protein
LPKLKLFAIKIVGITIKDEKNIGEKKRTVFKEKPVIFIIQYSR